jgi:hypothetical protein
MISYQCLCPAHSSSSILSIILPLYVYSPRNLFVDTAPLITTKPTLHCHDRKEPKDIRACKGGLSKLPWVAEFELIHCNVLPYHQNHPNRLTIHHPQCVIRNVTIVINTIVLVSFIPTHDHCTNCRLIITVL